MGASHPDFVRFGVCAADHPAPGPFTHPGLRRCSGCAGAEHPRGRLRRSGLRGRRGHPDDYRMQAQGQPADPPRDRRPDHRLCQRTCWHQLRAIRRRVHQQSRRITPGFGLGCRRHRDRRRHPAGRCRRTAIHGRLSAGRCRDQITVELRRPGISTGTSQTPCW